jgi:hypothetical protein
MGQPGSSSIAVHWHLDPCAGDDQLHLALADAMRLSGEAGDRACLVAYNALRRGILERHGVEVLRAVVEVRRDVDSTSYTLRGPGGTWGALTERVVTRAPGPVVRRKGRGKGRRR